ncbi:helix-turn-helix transcriptional regulator, partial [Limosilactobacillus reuteri]|uniref:helix-turn-helix transcriptional regulator n=2 Tax=Limosilactobacillus reuteri TaxID=1598 RepID=UPI002989AE8C
NYSNGFIDYCNHISTYLGKSEVNRMPSTMPGRELIKKYLKERSISIADLAKAYGLARQDVTDYLSGRNTSPKSNQFVLKVIKDLKI